ncbi:MAG: hypothetical protein V7L29_11140 [Nostoc sp.]|uniref:hypothetical protein n=1 Tax=Nostoc sp. TaxID=1180 RepID=UPI002FEF4670
MSQTSTARRKSKATCTERSRKACANCSPLALRQADALYETLRVASFPEGIRGLALSEAMPKALRCAIGGNRRSTPVPLSGGTPSTDWLDSALFTRPTY